MSKNLVYITNQPKKKVHNNVTYKALPFAFPFACIACVNGLLHLHSGVSRSRLLNDWRHVASNH